MTSAVVLGKIADLDSVVIDVLNGDEDVGGPDTPDLVTISQAVAGVIIIAAIGIIVYQIVMIFLRCLGLEVCNQIFIIAVVMVSPVTAVCTGITDTQSYKLIIARFQRRLYLLITTSESVPVNGLLCVYV